MCQNDIEWLHDVHFWDAMRSPFREKYNFDSMFIADLVMWRQWCHPNVDRIRKQHYYVNLFHISSKFELFIAVDMFMCRALICVEEIRVHYHVNDRSRF